MFNFLKIKIKKMETKIFLVKADCSLQVHCLRACLIIRGSKRNLMKMRTNFHKFSVNSRTTEIKFGRIGAIFMGLQPIHQLSNGSKAHE